MDKELARFKSEINLTEYAAGKGYQLDRKESSGNSIVMREPVSNDKVIMSKGGQGHWTYFSVRDRSDNGSIIDFVQKRSGVTLGGVRLELRPWLAGEIDRPSPEQYRQDVKVVGKDRQKVRTAFDRTRIITDSRYLNSRGITRETIASERFRGMVRMDERQNLVFPHYDRQGLAGFEVKNSGFTGFVKHGEKRAWQSNFMPGDKRLVLTESAIDAMSYHQLKGDPLTRYMSTGGQFSEAQRELVKEAMQSLPKGGQVVLAFDNDAPGHRYAQEFSKLAPRYVRVLRSVPVIGKDWNEQLMGLLKKRGLSKGMSR